VGEHLRAFSGQHLALPQFGQQSRREADGDDQHKRDQQAAQQRWARARRRDVRSFEPRGAVMLAQRLHLALEQFDFPQQEFRILGARRREPFRRFRFHSRSSFRILSHGRPEASFAAGYRPAVPRIAWKPWHQQAADHGPAQGRVLFAAFAEPQRHRQHAQNHSRGGHNHGPDAHRACRQRGGAGVQPLDPFVVGKHDHQDAVRRGHGRCT